MKSFRLIIAVSLLCIVSYRAYLLFSETETSSVSAVGEGLEQSSLHLVPKEQVISNVLTSDENPGAQDEEGSLVTMAMQIDDIATAYSESAKYPRGSQPILNPQALVVFEDFEENATSFGLESDYYGEIQVSVATKQYQHFSGDSIEIRVALSQVPLSETVSATAQLSTIDGEVLTELELEPKFNESWELQGLIDDVELEGLDLPPELQLNAIIQVGVETFFSSAALKYAKPSATIQALDTANPNAEYLDIPISIDVHTKGYFYLSAVLFDASGKRPLVQLQQEARLNEGEDDITLKAHIQALKRQGDEGPYVLKHFELRRGAEEGEGFDQAGNTNIDEALVEGFSFERYEDKNFNNPLAKEREAFLRRLGNTMGD